MRERGCFPATILERLRRPYRPRHPYAVPRAFLQCVCTRRRNCIAQLSPSREYALRTVDFPALNSATIPIPKKPRANCSKLPTRPNRSRTAAFISRISTARFYFGTAARQNLYSGPRGASLDDELSICRSAHSAGFNLNRNSHFGSALPRWVGGMKGVTPCVITA